MAGTAALLRRTYDAKLDDKATRGTVVERRIPDVPFVFDPSTVTRARNFYLVVNADFRHVHDIVQGRRTCTQRRR